MCSVGDMFDVYISGDATMCEYVCSDCGNKSKGLPVDHIECPACHSSNLSKK